MAGIAFLVLAGGTDPTTHRTVLHTPDYDLTVVAVPSYAEAMAEARALYQAGIATIELCGGFGHQGAAAVAGAVPGAHVGVVRFDSHPGLNGQSGDIYFGTSKP